MCAKEDKKCPPVGVEFNDLSYSVSTMNGGRNCILKSLSGCFRPGELTAILGPSGAGKSTLLNVLVGLLSSGVSGSVTNNGHPRQMALFHKLSTYIMQEDLVETRVTVQESMELAANLKLGEGVTEEQRKARITDILTTLGLDGMRDTMTEDLSGGQRKRLSVSLELVNNPPIVFLDEPTTGLDVVSMNQCISALKKLAAQGRTVICTMHQPSAMQFQQMDQVYVIGRGRCVYQGRSQHMVRYLASFNIHCPLSYNPADFVMDLVQEGNFVDTIKVLSSEMQNGKLCYQGSDKGELLYALNSDPLPEESPSELYRAVQRNDQHSVEFASSFLYQFQLLLARNFRQLYRNKVSLVMQVVFHVVVGTLMGIISLDTGNDGHMPFNNFKLLVALCVCYIYPTLISHTLTYPTEMKILKKEYLNRWYGLKPYFMAQTIMSFPLQLTLGTMFAIIVYIMSGHPLELYRMLLFCSVCLLCAFISEGHGLIVGSIFNHVNGAIVAPVTVAPLVVMSVNSMGSGMVVEPVRQFVRSLSYVHYVLTGLTLSVFDLGRKNLPCDEAKWVYCHYKDPQKLLEDLGMKGQSMWVQILVLVMFCVLYRLAVYLALRVQLTLEFRNRINNFIKKLLWRK